MSSGSDVPVAAIFKTASGFERAGEIIAESSCWSMLKGGLTVEASGAAELYFEVYFIYHQRNKKKLFGSYLQIG